MSYICKTNKQTETMKINFDKIICINLTSLNAQQLFAVCETYFIGFEELYRRKTETKVSMYWILEGKIVAFVIGGFFYLGKNFESISKEDQDKIKSIKPVKTPKIPKTEQTLINYKAFLAEGYDIRTLSMDSKLHNLESRKDSVYVKDVVNALIKTTENNEYTYEIFNVGLGIESKIIDIANYFNGVIEYVEARKEPKRSCSDIIKIKNVLGWKPTTNLIQWLDNLENK